MYLWVYIYSVRVRDRVSSPSTTYEYRLVHASVAVLGARPQDSPYVFQANTVGIACLVRPLFGLQLSVDRRRDDDDDDDDDDDGDDEEDDDDEDDDDDDYDDDDEKLSILHKFLLRKHSTLPSQ